MSSSLAGGLLIPHPNGIVIHPYVVIGPNCLIFQQVTISGGHSGASRAIQNMTRTASSVRLADLALCGYLRDDGQGYISERVKSVKSTRIE